MGGPSGTTSAPPQLLRILVNDGLGNTDDVALPPGLTPPRRGTTTLDRPGLATALRPAASVSPGGMGTPMDLATSGTPTVSQPIQVDEGHSFYLVLFIGFDWDRPVGNDEITLHRTVAKTLTDKQGHASTSPVANDGPQRANYVTSGTRTFVIDTPGPTFTVAADYPLRLQADFDLVARYRGGQELGRIRYSIDIRRQSVHDDPTGTNTITSRSA